ncbi:hypothetical protein GEMRC1_007649 [Eukaryota sp. GEM-RC1]
MIGDVKNVSTELNSQLNFPTPGVQQLSVIVGSSKDWRLDSGSCRLLPQFESTWENLRTFYTNKFQSRRLTLIPTKSVVHLQTSIYGPPVTIRCYLPQAQVLLLLRPDPKFAQSYSSLQQELRVDDISLNNVLLSMLPFKSNGQSLIFRKAHKKTPGKVEFTPKDLFVLNPKFRTSAQLISLIQGSADHSSTKENPALMESRRHVLEASIVRVLKTDRRVSFTDLKQRVQDILINKFAIEREFFKNTLESLQQREYCTKELNENEFEKKKSGVSYRLIHDKVHSLLTSTGGNRLQDFLGERMLLFGQSSREYLLQHKGRITLLPTLAERWQVVLNSAHHIFSLFSLVNITADDCKSSFLDGLLGYNGHSDLNQKIKESLKNRLSNILNLFVDEDNTLDTTVNLLLSIKNQSLFREIFELPFLEFLTSYYTAKAAQDIQRPLHEYVQEVHDSMSLVQNLCELKLQNRFLKETKEIVHNTMLIPYVPSFFDDPQIIQNWIINIDSEQNLKFLEQFYGLIHPLQTIVSFLTQSEVPRLQLNNRKVVEDFVKPLISFCQLYFNEVVPKCFLRNLVFSELAEKTFREVFKTDHYEDIAIVLIHYVHHLLCATESQISDDEFVVLFESVFCLIPFLPSPDAFYTTHSLLLQNRLLSQDYTEEKFAREEIVLNKFKTTFEDEFGTATQMISDVKNVSKELSSQLNFPTPGVQQLSVIIGSTKDWTLDLGSCRLLPQFESTWENLRTFYDSKFPARNLTLIPATSIVHLQTSLYGSPVTVRCLLPQAQVLLLLRSHPKFVVSYHYLLQESGVDEKTLDDVLTLLLQRKCNKKSKLCSVCRTASNTTGRCLNCKYETMVIGKISKKPTTKDDAQFAPQDVFLLNPKFKPSMPTLSLLPTSDVLSTIRKNQFWQHPELFR